MNIDNVSSSPNSFAQVMIAYLTEQGLMVQTDVSGVTEVQRGNSYLRFLPDFDAVGMTTIYETALPMYAAVGAAGAYDLR